MHVAMLPRLTKGGRVVRKLVGGLFVALVVWFAATPSANAEGEQITGFVRNQTTKDGKSVREPVPNVKIAFSTADGKSIGVVTTDAKGGYTQPVPGPGGYIAEIDQSSLPKGVALANASQAKLTVTVAPGGSQILNYFLGKDTRSTKGRWGILPQTLANGVKSSMIIAVCAVGLSLIYGTTGLSNFAHGELVTLGAIVAWNMNQQVGLHVLLAAPIGIAAAAIAGLGNERLLWRPLRHKGTSLTSMMIISIGLGIGVRYIYLFFFGGRAKAFREYAVQKAHDFGPFSLTSRDLVTIGLCLVLLVAFAMYLLRTRMGKAIRAVSDNPDLASATGIDADHVILLVWGLGGALAGLGGILLGLDQQVRWDSGFSLLLLMFAAITLGGLGNPFGALAGAFVIGMFVELWTWIFPSVIELKTLGALATLILVLLVRPQGLLGRKERTG